MYNLFLAVKPIFDSVTTAGGEVTVRLERDKIDLGGDVTDVIKSLDSTDHVSAPFVSFLPHPLTAPALHLPWTN